MSMQYIRKYYGVPAKRGGRIVYTGGYLPREGTIVGSIGAHLKLRLDGDNKASAFHPTWEIEYRTEPIKGGGNG